MEKQKTLQVPGGAKRVLLHTCCAPCSSAIIERLVECGVEPVIFYCNPNIYPYEEYLVRKEECTRYAQSLGLDIVDADYDHSGWLECTRGHEDEPERAGRCLNCFRLRLSATARYAHENGFSVITSTLDSSRWKSHDQIVQAGQEAVSVYPDVTFWDQNWRKDGLQQRRSEIIREMDFYNQRYCGCEFSMRSMTDDKSGVRKRIKRLISVMTEQARLSESNQIWNKLEESELFIKAERVLLYWSMADEVNTHDFIRRWYGKKRIYLPSIDGNDLLIREYTGDESMVPGPSFGIPEPVGPVLENLSEINLIIVPGRAFDLQGNRMGRGRGFYDRLLASVSCPKVGVAFNCQMIPSVPVDENDIKMDLVVS